MSGTLANRQGTGAGLRGGRRLNRDVLNCAMKLLLCLEVVAFAFFVAGTHGGIVKLDTPVSTDFVSFYAAGILTAAGTPALVYQQAIHYLAEQAATEPGVTYNFFYYPPI